MSGGYTGRFAPSPTGALHIGSLLCALASYLDARASGGRWLVRIEDIDPPREKAGAASAILRTLESHGLYWDSEVVFQSCRHALYEAAMDRLRRDDHAFPCSLSRTFLEAHGPRHPGRAVSARHHGDDEAGTAWRVDVPDRELRFDDRVQGSIAFNLSKECGPFVVKRRDGFFAYQLAVSVDDADQGVTDVVRGSDLLDSTPRQMLLQDYLGLPTPRYAHIPVIVDAMGNKLGKQDDAAPVTPGREMQNLRLALQWLRQPTHPAAGTVEELLHCAVKAWDIRKVPRCRSIPLQPVT